MGGVQQQTVQQTRTVHQQQQHQQFHQQVNNSGFQPQSGVSTTKTWHYHHHRFQYLYCLILNDRNEINNPA